MTSKVFYQSAAEEVAAGALDNALWTKVSADMPSADAMTQQAKYIQLRAQELALSAKKNAALSIWRRIPWWVKWPAIIFTVVFVLGELNRYSQIGMW
jgi:hypothetical protein